MKITLTGATGFIGRHLVAKLLSRGDELTILSRRPREGSNPRYLAWDARSAPPPEALDAGAIIHLTGESVAQRWTAEAKQRIRSSRIDSTRALITALGSAANKPEFLISASAIGIYGDRGDEVLTEKSPPGSGFLEDLSVEWEAESQRATEFGIRVLNPRIGIVLGRDGGALPRMLAPFKAGVGGKLGSGQQWMSWIHIDDVIGLLLFALDRRDLHGPMNATAPSPARNRDFTEQLAAVLKRPAFFTVPAFALKLMMGEMGEVVVASERVIPEVARAAGYAFRYPELRAALEALLWT